MMIVINILCFILVNLHKILSDNWLKGDSSKSSVVILYHKETSNKPSVSISSNISKSLIRRLKSEQTILTQPLQFNQHSEPHEIVTRCVQLILPNDKYFFFVYFFF